MESISKRVKIVITSLVLTTLFGIVLTIFWVQQMQFLLPTPIPADHREVPLGVQPVLSDWEISANTEMSLLHFYSADCPCSRFNLTHFKSLVRQFGDQVKFYVVTQSSDTSIAEDVSEYGVEVIKDTDGTIAKRCGVYATPQAVILDDKGAIVYRGNYNQARFCTDKKSWFAQIVIESHLGLSDVESINRSALVPYGCSLPADRDNLAKGQMNLANKLSKLIN